MYAIFEDGGKQYKVSPGDQVLVEIRERDEAQNQIVFDQVLMVGEGDSARVGTPLVGGAKVVGKVLAALKTPKVTGIKFNRRKGYRKKWGHRQNMLRVEIGEIQA